MRERCHVQERKTKTPVCAEAEALLTKAPREGQQGRATVRPHRRLQPHGTFQKNFRTCSLGIVDYVPIPGIIISIHAITTTAEETGAQSSSVNSPRFQ